jgi:hypothetical protein
LLVICTSVNIHLLQEMELTECFSVTLRVPQISSKEEFTSALK